MTDPAVEAAQRAFPKKLGEMNAWNNAPIAQWHVNGAREALKQAREDLQPVDDILGLLHHRGLIDTEQNRADVELALGIVQRYTRG